MVAPVNTLFPIFPLSRSLILIVYYLNVTEPSFWRIFFLQKISHRVNGCASAWNKAIWKD